MEAKELKEGGVTSAQGFRASGVACGIKARGAKDLALVVSDVPAEAAAAFTTNVVKAAPVRVSMRHMRNGKMRGVVLSAGCANACTGLRGIADAKEMVERAAKKTRAKPGEWLVCSTGRIGNRLPMAKVRKGIEKAAFVKKAGQHLRLGRADSQPAQLPGQMSLELVSVDHAVLLHHGADGAVVAHQQQVGLLQKREPDRLHINGNRIRLLNGVHQALAQLALRVTAHQHSDPCPIGTVEVVLAAEADILGKDDLIWPIEKVNAIASTGIGADGGAQRGGRTLGQRSDRGVKVATAQRALAHRLHADPLTPIERRILAHGGSR